MKDIERWSIEQSREQYGINYWGAGYFDISRKGSITVAPDGPNGPKIDLAKLVEQVTDRDIKPPVLFRFNGILRHRIRSIYKAFESAIAKHEYSGKYIPAYPIKVNQQRHVVDVIRQSGQEFAIALEVGSKPELIAVLGVHDNPEAFLICNGYKDRSYIELALMSQKIGRRPIIVIEKSSELDLVLEVSERLGIVPEVGLRLRLSGKGAGRWERSGGDRAKFGLTAAELLRCVSLLRRRERIDSLRLLHFHAGSQLTSIATLGAALKEAGQVYAQLRRECPKLDYMDVGGGLGVDYDGSKTTFSSSMNYTVEEYARDVVWVLDDICEQNDVPRPNIITESGRAIAAYHSILVCNVLGIANTFSEPCDPEEIIASSDHQTVRNLAFLLKEVNAKNCQETLHDAVTLKNDLAQQFKLGVLTLEERALGERCYWAVLNQICRYAEDLHYVPEDLQRLPAVLSDTYFCNFSIFQSLPDSWAIQQIFPVMPLARLDEKPDTPVVLADITCDSDGSIDRFPDLRDVKRYLAAHRLNEGEPYYFATFLLGAYQEILGDLHNLFGDTNAVHVEVGEDGKVELSHVVNGDTVSDVLRYVQFDKEDLCQRWRNSLERAVNKGSITAAESGNMFRQYSQAFEGYTYLVASESKK